MIGPAFVVGVHGLHEEMRRALGLSASCGI
jgi:hypothetical protein